jgi:hypothetical protein
MPTSIPDATPGFILTPALDIAATVTAVRRLPALAPEQAAPYLEIRELVLVCDELHP